MRAALALLAALVGTACQTPPAPEAVEPTAEAADSAQALGWLGRAWVRTAPADGAGALRVFLADGTLVLGGCGGGYTLAAWEPVAPDVAAWVEGFEGIEGHFALDGPDALTLRLVEAGDTLVERYRAADVPSACPEPAR